MPTESSGAVAAASSGEIVGPIHDIVQTASGVVWNMVAANLPKDLHWQYLLITVTIATCIWLIRRGGGSKGADGRERKTGLVQFLLPRDVYFHESARVDIWLWVTERVLRPFWALGLFVTIGPLTESSVINLLRWVFGETPALQSNLPWMMIYSLAILLVYDLVFFATHYTMHKVPALWAIHKVHHSAEVLTPLTRSREHFIAGPIWAAGGAISYGFVGGVFAYLFDGGITAATVFNIGVFSLLFGLTGSFRHYHVQFHYPMWLSKWLHSPVMHHIHHSYLQKHWDMNFAAVTSIWDRMFGTLYIPEKDEYTPWGIGPETQANYRSYWQNTSGPFRDWYAMLTDSRSSQAGAVESHSETKIGTP
jgi:sterol desaturase/sphingolipid hydroxylase (fatty acid hydroxylase superfamily)